MLNYKNDMIPTHKVFHIADMQYEARATMKGNRYDEFMFMNNEIVDAIKEEAPDLIIIAGDVFQFAATTANEQALFINLLKRIGDIPTIIIAGNHDIKQKNNGILNDGDLRPEYDSIDTCVDAIAKPNTVYWKYTGFYQHPLFDYWFAVHSQYNKHLNYLKLPYNPWDIDTWPPSDKVIDLFHDPVSGINKMFDGSDNHQEKGVEKARFKGNSVIAGDIHTPSINIIGKKGGKDVVFAYCSSTCMRNYGEGNKMSFDTNKRYLQEGNPQHGYMVWELDESGFAVSVDFHEIKRHTNRLTIFLGKEFDKGVFVSNLDTMFSKSAYTNLKLVNKGGDRVRLMLPELSELIKQHGKIAQLDIENDSTVDLADENDVELDDVEVLFDHDMLKEYANDYIKGVVARSRSISKDNKEKATEDIFELVSNGIEKVDLSTSSKDIRIKSFEIENFLAIDKVSYKIEGNKLVRVTGSNGVGKTTIIKALTWAWTDRVTGNEKMNQVKRNRLQLFNKECPDRHTLTVSVCFSVNGEEYEINKTLVRTMKRGKEASGSNWIKDVSSLELEYELFLNGSLLSNDPKSVLEYMEEIITFDYTNTIFINRSRLHDYLNNPSIERTIIENVGIDCLSSIESEYDDNKDTYMSKFPNPSGKVETKQAELDKCKEFIDTNKSDLLELENSQSLILENVKNNQAEIDRIKSELKPVDDSIFQKVMDKKYEIRMAEQRSKEVLSRMENTRLKLTKLKTKIESTNTYIKSLAESIQSYEAQKKSLSGDVSAIEDRKAEILSKISILESERDAAIANGKTAVGDIKLNVRSTIENEVDVLRTQKESLSNEVNKIKYEAQVSYNNHRNRVTEISGKIELLTSKKENKIQKVKELEEHLKGGKCSMCGTVTEPDDETIDRVNSNIAKLRSEISEFEAKLSEHKSELSNLKSLPPVIDQDKIDSIDNEIKSIDSSIKNIKNSFDKRVDDERANSKIVSDSKLKYKNTMEQISTLNREIESLDASAVGQYKEICDNIKSAQAISKEQLAKQAEFLEEEKRLEIKKGTDEQTLEDTDVLIKTLYASLSDLQEKENEASVNKSYNEESENVILAYEEENSVLEFKSNEHRDNIISKTQTIKEIKIQFDRILEEIEQLNRYKTAQQTMRIYKTVLGESGLIHYLFKKITGIINNHLKQKLSSLPFDLRFTENGLYKVSSSGQMTPVEFTSGMEEVMCGLALVNSVSGINRTFKCNMMFIDELSGQLNSGDGLKVTENVRDYQELFKRMLGIISSEKHLMVVDHVIDDIGENSTMEVYMGDNGAKILEY